MVEPFYMRYETEFNGKKNYYDIYKHFTNVRENMFNEDKQLHYHGWDTAKKLEWADKQTGLSKNFWLRAIGWHLMAMVDTLEYMSEEIFDEYRGLQILFKEAINGVVKYQDEQSKMWYQVVDKMEEKGNYLETSGTLMIVYAMMKGARLGYLNEKYSTIGYEAFKGVCEKYLHEDEEEGKLALGGICLVAGLGNFNGQVRDGSYEYYLSEPVVNDDVKGSGIFLMAYSEVKFLEKRRRKIVMKNRKITGYLFIAPWIIGFLVFTAYPFISSLWLSFTNYNLLSAPKFVGIDNYIKLFNDPLFIKTLMNTLKYVFITVPVKLAFALFIANI